jgi:hypothetical protein
MAIVFGSPEANQIAEADRQRQRQRQIDAGYSPSWRSADGWQLVDLFLSGDDSPAQRRQHNCSHQDDQGGNAH